MSTSDDRENVGDSSDADMPDALSKISSSLQNCGQELESNPVGPAPASHTHSPLQDIDCNSNIEEGKNSPDSPKQYLELSQTRTLPIQDAGLPRSLEFSDNSVLHKIVFTWTINQFSIKAKLNERVESDEFECAEHSWKLFCFPRGNVNTFADTSNKLSAYVKVTDLINDDQNIKIKFSFQVINTETSDVGKKWESEHIFTKKEHDRGFNCIIDYQEILDKFLVDDDLSIRILLENIEEPRERTHYPDFYQNLTYNSRRKTGFVGLRNQGATCYMNSLLQTLYTIPQLRSAVYLMPTEDIPPNEKNEKESIGLALQRVFYQLQTTDDAVDTQKLTQSFGWDSFESFMQHDVQEFSRVLCDNLEEKMKETRVDGKIAQLFRGKQKMYVKCIHVDYKSDRTESFYDLALNVKNCPTLAKSFEQYIEEETLEGENQYRAEGHGTQDAKKGVKFLSFPPVLQLQLKRFEYDCQREMMVKVNDRLEFPTTLDLTEYKDQEVTPDENDPPLYKLHSVLVHSGTVLGGHYYAFIRPFPREGTYDDAPWYKFDDEHVDIVSEKQAVDANFGVESKLRSGGLYNRWSSANANSNAYMLVYIRQEHVQNPNTINADMSEYQEEIIRKDMPPQLHVPIPKQLYNRFKKEEEFIKMLIEEKRKEHLYKTILVTIEEDILNKPCGTEFNLENTYDREKAKHMENEDQCENNSEDDIYCVKYNEVKSDSKGEKNATVRQWGQNNAEKLNLKLNTTEYWLHSKRRNETRRPNKQADENEIFENISKDELPWIYIRSSKYDELIPEIEMMKLQNEEQRTLLIFKYFDVANQCMTIIGSGVFLMRHPCSHLIDYARHLLKVRNFNGGHYLTHLKLNTDNKYTHETDNNKKKNADLNNEIPLKAYEEECAMKKSINPIKLDHTIKEMKLQNGDLICIQQDYQESELITFQKIHKERWRASKREMNIQKEEDKEIHQQCEKKDSEKQIFIQPHLRQDFFRNVYEYLIFLDQRVEINFTELPQREKRSKSNRYTINAVSKIRKITSSVIRVSQDKRNFLLELTQIMDYQMIANKVADILGLDDPGRIRLYKAVYPNYGDHALRTELIVPGIEWDGKKQRLIHWGMQAPQLYFSIHTFSWEDLKTNYTPNITYINIHYEETKIDILVPQNASIKKVIDIVRDKMRQIKAIQKKNTIPKLRCQKQEKKYNHDPHEKTTKDKKKTKNSESKEPPIKKQRLEDEQKIEVNNSKKNRAMSHSFRMIQCKNHRIVTEIMENSLVSEYFNEGNHHHRFGSEEYIIEEVPHEQINLSKGQKIVWIARCCSKYNDPCCSTKSYGIPFSMVIIPGEKFPAFKKRIQIQLRHSVEEFKRFQIIYFKQTSAEVITDDEMIISDLDLDSKNVLGLRDTRYSGKQKKKYNPYSFYNSRPVKINAR